MHYLITGHTGFKGAWLTLLLRRRGHRVSGLSLDPPEESLFERARVSEVLTHDVRGDIRDLGVVVRCVEAVQPDVIIHMAAQALVRDSYRQPRLTHETNVMGTLNVLDAAAAMRTVRAQLIVTTDKVYRNDGRGSGYREDDALGGTDPYSASKAMADLLAQSWNRSAPGAPMAVARAGNVLGGGDVSHERLLPDVIRALQAGRVPVLRNPSAIRPWQHVLDCLNGYCLLVEHLLGIAESEPAPITWNIGPPSANLASVSEVTDLACAAWGARGGWAFEPDLTFHEEARLTLDASRAETVLRWRTFLPTDEAVEWTVSWCKTVAAGADPRECTERQIADFLERALPGERIPKSTS